MALALGFLTSGYRQPVLGSAVGKACLQDKAQSQVWVWCKGFGPVLGIILHGVAYPQVWCGLGATVVTSVRGQFEWHCRLCSIPHALLQNTVLSHL